MIKKTKIKIMSLIIALMLFFSICACSAGSLNNISISNDSNQSDFKTKSQFNVSANLNVNNTSNTNIYVDGLNGNDQNTGVRNSPKKTIQSAVSSVNNSGSIYVADGEYNLNNCSINKNITIEGQSKENTIIVGNNNQICIIKSGKSLKLSKLTFTNGNADDGGAIKNNGTLIATECIFRHNNAQFGGAIMNYGNCQLINDNFEDNIAITDGGAIENYLNGSLNVSSTIFNNNQASEGAGGSIMSHNKISICNCNFKEGNAKKGGAICNRGDLLITNSNYTFNAANLGGSIYNGGKMIINCADFSKNSGEADGGVIYNYGSTSIIELDNCKFNNNKADNGAVIFNHGSFNLNNSAFSNNHASTDGGVISNTGNLNISNSNLNKNDADKGGVIYTSGNTIILNCDFNENKAKNGGVLYILSTPTKTEITSNAFNNNKASENGGAIYSSGNINIKSNAFTENNASNGGAIYNIFAGTSINIKDNKITKNTANNGGALFNIGKVTLTNNNINFNIVTENGGAIFNSKSGNLYIKEQNKFFYNNINQGPENAIYNEGTLDIRGDGNKFTDSTITNKGHMDIKECVLEKNYDGQEVIKNEGIIGINENCSNQYSNHQHRKIYPSRHHQNPHFDNVNDFTIKQGDTLKDYKIEAWIDDGWYDILQKEPLNILIYNESCLLFNKTVTTNSVGNAYVTINTNNMPPGNYVFRVVGTYCVKTCKFTVSPHMV